MIPYSFTITSSAAVTFFFSITFFIGITLVGDTTHKDTLFQILLPAGVPLIIAPFLIVVEAVSYFARVFSLAIRLFANMLSGHALLKILGSFV
jgi:ATP synthase subunit 6